MARDPSMIGEGRSPGGYMMDGQGVFGIQGWSWGDPRPHSITFFLDGSVKVSDQHGRRIRGAVIDGKDVLFAPGPPDDADRDGRIIPRAGLATHAQVIAALAADRIEWEKLATAGWPQLPYEELKKLADAGKLPPTPAEELVKIRDIKLRKDALRIRRETDDVLARELGELDEDDT